MTDFDYSRIEHYFSIAFKIDGKYPESGASIEMVNKFISQEFKVHSPQPIKRHFEDMVLAKFIKASVGGMKANERLEKQHAEFLKRKGNTFKAVF